MLVHRIQRKVPRRLGRLILPLALVLTLGLGNSGAISKAMNSLAHHLSSGRSSVQAGSNPGCDCLIGFPFSGAVLR